MIGLVGPLVLALLATLAGAAVGVCRVKREWGLPYPYPWRRRAAK